MSCIALGVGVGLNVFSVVGLMVRRMDGEIKCVSL